MNPKHTLILKGINDNCAPQIGYNLLVQTLASRQCIFLTVQSVHFIGNGLRAALDPRLKL